MDPQIDHIILVNKQFKYPDNVTVFEDTEGIVAFGKTITVLPIKISHGRKTKKVDEDVLMQLNFLIMLKQITKVTILNI